MIAKTDIKSLSKEELALRLKELGAEAYRPAQIFKWIYQRLAGSFDDMTDIPGAMREASTSWRMFSPTRVMRARIRSSLPWK